VLLGAPLAFLSVRYAFPFRKWWNAAVLVPLIMPPFVGAIGL
jgi:iron(III) transport system permease protein